MDEPTPAHPPEPGAPKSEAPDSGTAESGAANPGSDESGAGRTDPSRRWNYVGAISAGVAALLIVAFGVAIPLQVIPPKKEEAVAMIVPPPPHRPPEYGLASWYGDHEAGQPTASGATFEPNALTAAHRWLPLGTKVRVTRLGTKHSTVVTINDRGPYVGGRLIDLSPAAARQLAMVKKGLARVRVDILEVPHPGTVVAKHKKPAKRPTDEIASQPVAPAPETASPTSDLKPVPAEAAATPQAKPVEAKPAAPAEPDSNTHFP